ncbi:hypothetical protein M5362_19700 [Streptomyces sp. Je 1-79]|uniref:hypothetical protein n=1 Tax=Streptomyces sp. Je 1-79 TaxID=2943847 RepID=UPI0021A7210C|nr:hypothetical protein [Streptomyces sp. Je 1-79]MCT4355363.1 hypothetical protein [Streptomyces sp. Je 1-79]
MRSVPRLAVLLLLPLALAVTGCGTKVLGATPPDRAELQARARALQTLPEHVYVTEADGFELAEQSVGVLGGDGFSATYVSKTGGQITIGVDRGTVDEKTCAAEASASGACEKDGKGWYRASGGRHAYLRTENGLRIQLTADTAGVDRAVLRAAAEKAHRADDAELDAVLPEETGPGEPVERGDLPPVGDGAPDNGVGASG